MSLLSRGKKLSVNISGIKKCGSTGNHSRGETKSNGTGWPLGVVRAKAVGLYRVDEPCVKADPRHLTHWLKQFILQEVIDLGGVIHILVLLVS